MKQLPCIKHYVLGQRLKTKVTMANNLTDTKLESQPIISTLDKYVTEKVLQSDKDKSYKPLYKWFCVEVQRHCMFQYIDIYMYANL